jgi:DNA polymerase-3 subunit beta
MKVIAQTAALQEALTLAGSIVAARTPKPVLQCVKLVAADGALTVLATDLEAGLRYTVPQVEVEEDGEALVPVGKLSDIVRESAGEQTISLSAEKDACVITGAGSRFRLLGYDPGEFPQVAEFEGDGDFQVPAETLTRLIEKTLFAAAKASSHYAISGILWEANGKKLQLVATDGHRLAVARSGLSSAAKGQVEAIVPSKFMNLLQRASAGSEETLAVSLTESQILIRTARSVLVSSLVQGNFPKYSDVIPKESSRKATLNCEAFLHRIRQAALLTSDESKGIRLDFQPEQLTLTSRAADTGEAEVTLPVRYDGDPMQIGFNPAFLLDALKVVDSDEVDVEMNAPAKPVVLRSGSEFLYVLMPVDLG